MNFLIKSVMVFVVNFALPVAQNFIFDKSSAE